MPSKICLDGLPLYYVNKFVCQDLKDGTIMLICGIMRCDIFMPLYSVVTPKECAIIDGGLYTAMARSDEAVH
jgi:hypothetical protein